MAYTELRSCSYCDGDYEIADVEPPDYEVGLMGYTVFIENEKFSTHDEDCPVRTMSPKEIEEIEIKLAMDWGQYSAEVWAESLVDLDY